MMENMDQDTTQDNHKDFWDRLTHGRPYEMVPRRDLRPGDEAASSHYGIGIIEKITILGDHGETTYLTWVGRERTEAYPSTDTIPLLNRHIPNEVDLGQALYAALGGSAFVDDAPYRFEPIAVDFLSSPVVKEWLAAHS